MSHLLKVKFNWETRKAKPHTYERVLKEPSVEYSKLWLMCFLQTEVNHFCYMKHIWDRPITTYVQSPELLNKQQQTEKMQPSRSLALYIHFITLVALLCNSLKRTIMSNVQKKIKQQTTMATLKAKIAFFHVHAQNLLQ